MTNYYELLGVSRGAEAPEITQIYRRLLQEQYQEMGKEADLSTLSQAHKTLTNSAKRRDYDARLDLLSGQFKVEDPEKPTKAEKSYLDGLKAFDLQNYQEAVQYFARAARLNPSQGHYFSLWGLSIGMFPGRLPEAELYCKKAIELDPDNPVFYFNLGFLYQRHNLSEAAQQSFAKAQEAQQVRHAKYSAQDAAAIAAPWRGDADSLLKELDSIEQTMGQSDGEQPSVIALPQAEVLSPKADLPEEPAPAAETAPEQIQVLAGEPADLSGVDDLLSELDSLESSMEKVETFHNGKTQESVEPEESNLETVTAQEELRPRDPEGEAQNHELQMEVESLSESSLDLLKELDSIESMVAGIEQAGTEDRQENLREQNTRNPSESHHPGLPAEKAVFGSNSEELEDEALKLLQELDVPLEAHDPEPVQVRPEEDDFSPVSISQLRPEPDTALSEADAQDIRQKMERLNQMEEQMMEELLKLKAERERLREDLKV
jgi:hypothetical protein